MSGFALNEIIEATSGRVIFRGREYFSGISIDSRTISGDELFIALRGARFDGHDFLDEALSRGAGAVVNYPPRVPVNGKTIIHVKNTLKALQDIARYNRGRRDVQVVGITGTNGKTTTKEMLCEILRATSSVLCSSGNLNNHIGLPLNLLRLEDEKLCVLEMGASRKGDIDELCAIASPDIGVITNVGPGHLEGFGSIETVRDTKLEITSYARTIVLNVDDAMLAPVADMLRDGGRQVVTCSTRTDAAVMARDIRFGGDRSSRLSTLSFELCVKGAGSVEVDMKISGLFNVYNALSAAAAAHVMGMSMQQIREGLERFSGVAMRLEIREMHGAVVISDVYNANPASMEEAVKELVRAREGRTIAVLGDMLELGSYAEEAHRKLGAWLAELPVDAFVAVGPLMSIAAEEFRRVAGERGREVYSAADAERARDIVIGMAGRGDTILIKGSRGMNMERILGGNGAV